MASARRLGLAGAALALTVLVLPLVALLWRTPWPRLPEILSRPEVGSAVWLSVWTSTVAMVAVVALGTPLALAMSRTRRRWARLARVLVSLPLVLPPVAAGMALLAAFGRRGVIGGPLGLQVPYTTVAVILSQAFDALPFYVITLEGGLRRDLKELEESAATQGASGWQVLRHITLPLVAPSLLAGLVLAWARALGEFGATITFAGNLPGITQTMPLALYLAVQHDPALAYALATLMLGASGLLLWLAQRPSPQE